MSEERITNIAVMQALELAVAAFEIDLAKNLGEELSINRTQCRLLARLN